MLIELHTEVLIPDDPLKEAATSIVLFTYTLAVIYSTKLLYDTLRSKGVSHDSAVYFNRKIIHVLAGGVIALILPTLFTSPTLPSILAAALSVVTWVPHRRGRLMYWFQVRENMHEVSFCLMWGMAVLLAWLFLGSPIYAQVPVLFMSFGDAATGLTRNFLFKRRTKSWWGNIAMFAVCAPIAYWLVGPLGIPLAGAASIIEHFELNPVDDNILISLTSLAGTVLVTSLTPA